MADLSNLKINESFQRVLQRDPTSGYLEDLLGNAPTNIIFNGTIVSIAKESTSNNDPMRFYVLIPPYTHVEVIFPNNATAADLTAVITGRVY